MVTLVGSRNLSSRQPHTVTLGETTGSKLLLIMIIIIIIKSISRASIYRTRWEHRAIYRNTNNRQTDRDVTYQLIML